MERRQGFPGSNPTVPRRKKHRLVLSAFALFWVLMNILLWRAEMSGRSPTGSPVSTEVVLQKILTAPDASTLEVHHRNRRVGYCHWHPDPGEEHNPTQTIFASDYVPEGMLRTRHHYVLKFDGHVQLETPDLRPRFEASLVLATNRSWQEFQLRITVKPSTLTIRASAPQQEVQWSYQEEPGPAVTNIFRWREPQDLTSLLPALGGSWASLLAAALPTASSSPPKLGLTWQAHHDRIRIGNAQMRVYRLETRILGRHDVRLIVNRVGEILRIDLPNSYRLVNEELWSL